MKPIILTIAGSDSSAGAGVQNDIKTIAKLGGYAVSALTCLTAQNPQKVFGVVPVKANFVTEQLVAIEADFQISAVKIGVISSVQQIHEISNFLQSHPEINNLVLDPVLVAQSGTKLNAADDQLINGLTKELFPRARLVTPNTHEASVLANIDVQGYDDFEKAAQKMIAMGAKCVLIKGGNFVNENLSRDLLYTKDQKIWLETERVASANSHGTGCTLSSAIATFLGHGEDLVTSVRLAKNFVTKLLTSNHKYQKGKIGFPDHFK